MSNVAAARAQWLEALFHVPVAAAGLRGDGDPQQLFPEERRGQERWAARRVSQYAAGRQCAHLALSQLGVQPQPLLAQPDRRPAWPPGVVGSISHCAGFCCAVVALQDAVRSVGVDAEVAGTVDESLWPRILSAEERTWLEQRPAADRRLWATIFFSAKEAFYKCQYPVRGHWLEFHDARMRVLSDPANVDLIELEIGSRELKLFGRGSLREGVVCTGFCWPV